MLHNNTASTSAFDVVRTQVIDPIAPRWIRPKLAADFLGTTEGTLAKWRHEGRGPVYYVPPGIRSVLYDLSELDRFVEAGRVETTGDAL